MNNMKNKEKTMKNHEKLMKIHGFTSVKPLRPPKWHEFAAPACCQVPPNVHLSELNPHIDLQDCGEDLPCFGWLFLGPALRIEAPNGL